MQKLILFCLALISAEILSAQSPGGIATNLELWLKGNSGITGTAPITGWADQSGNSIPSTVSGNPALSSSSLNYNDVISFDGTGDYFTTGLSINEASYPDLSVIAVYKPNVNTAGAPWGEDNGGWDRFLLDGNTSTLNNMVSQGTGALTDINNIFVPNTPVITTVVFDEDAANGSFVYANANQELNFTSNHGPETSNNLQIGALGVNNFNFNGNIAECIVYSQVLSSLDRNKVETYLAIKYGITLDNSAGATAGDYTASNNTLLWDADVNATYHNDITAIGRDDNSDLDQQKSLSINSGAMVVLDKGAAFGSNNAFVLAGHDAQGTTVAATNSHPSLGFKMNRTWKASVSGVPGTISVSFIYPNNGITSDYALLLDPTDTDFSTGATAHTSGVSINGDTITFTGVTLANDMFFTLGTNDGSPSPGGVLTNLELWLKGNAGITGIAPITGWTDQSSNGVTNVVSGDPTLSSSGLNYNSVIVFDGTGDYITTNLNINEATFPDLSIIAVYLPNINDAGGVWGEDDGAWDRIMLDAENVFAPLESCIGNGTGPESGIPEIFDPGESVMTSVLFDEDVANGSFVYADGNLVRTFSSNHGPESSSNLQIGAIGVNNYNFNGDIAEFIVYSEVLSTADRNKIESYLGLKYGITLNNNAGATAGDYTSSGGTLLWDADSNPLYHNDVIGIGRDVAQEFYQKQSKTQDDSLIVYINNLAANNEANVGVVSNNESYLLIGNDKRRLQSTAASNAEKPVGIATRWEREWKITNTNFNDSYTLEFEWDSVSAFDINDIRLLVDTDGDFSNATVLSVADGLTFSVGSIIVGGINTSHIPANSTRFITIGSVRDGTSLPIDLVDFTAQVHESNTVLLEWETASEINNDYFTIERSTNGINWEVVEKVAGAGNSLATLSYSAIDTEPYYGVSYYRLMQTDFDGTLSYSPIRSVNLTKQNTTDIRIYPNPTNTRLTIEGAASELETVFIYNAVGQNVTHLLRKTQGNNSRIVFNVSGLSQGLYYIKTKTRTKKLFKQ